MPATLRHADVGRIIGSWPVLRSLGGTPTLLPNTLDRQATILGVVRETTAGYDVSGRTLIFHVDGNSPFPVTFTYTGNLPLAEVVDQINTVSQALIGDDIAFKDNGFLRLKSPTIGDDSYLRLEVDPSSTPTDVFLNLGLFAESEAFGGDITQAQHVDPDRQVSYPGQLSMAEGENLDAKVINRAVMQLAINADHADGQLTKKRIAAPTSTGAFAYAPVTPEGYQFSGGTQVYVGQTAAPDVTALSRLFKVLDSSGHRMAKEFHDVIQTFSSPVLSIDSENNGAIQRQRVTVTGSPFTTSHAKGDYYIEAYQPSVTGPAKIVEYIDANNVYVQFIRISDGVELFYTVTPGVLDFLRITQQTVHVDAVLDAPGGSRVEGIPLVKRAAIVPTRVEKGSRIVFVGENFTLTPVPIIGDVLVWSGHGVTDPYSNNASYRISKIVDRETLEVVSDDWGPAILNPDLTSGVPGTIDIQTDGYFYKDPFIRFGNVGTYTPARLAPDSGESTQISYHGLSNLKAATEDPAFFTQDHDDDFTSPSEDIFQQAILALAGPTYTSVEDYLQNGDKKISLEPLWRSYDVEHDHISGKHRNILADSLSFSSDTESVGAVHPTTNRRIHINDIGVHPDNNADGLVEILVDYEWESGKTTSGVVKAFDVELRASPHPTLPVKGLEMVGFDLRVRNWQDEANTGSTPLYIYGHRVHVANTGNSGTPEIASIVIEPPSNYANDWGVQADVYYGIKHNPMIPVLNELVGPSNHWYGLYLGPVESVNMVSGTGGAVHGIYVGRLWFEYISTVDPLGPNPDYVYGIEVDDIGGWGNPDIGAGPVLGAYGVKVGDIYLSNLVASRTRSSYGLYVEDVDGGAGGYGVYVKSCGAYSTGTSCGFYYAGTGGDNIWGTSGGPTYSYGFACGTIYADSWGVGLNIGAVTPGYSAARSIGARFGVDGGITGGATSGDAIGVELGTVTSGTSGTAYGLKTGSVVGGSGHSYGLYVGPVTGTAETHGIFVSGTGATNSGLTLDEGLGMGIFNQSPYWQHTSANINQHAILSSNATTSSPYYGATTVAIGRSLGTKLAPLPVISGTDLARQEYWGYKRDVGWFPAASWVIDAGASTFWDAVEPGWFGNWEQSTELWYEAYPMYWNYPESMFHINAKDQRSGTIYLQCETKITPSPQINYYRSPYTSDPTDGKTIAGTGTFQSPNATFITAGWDPANTYLLIAEGADAGRWSIASIDSETQLTVSGTFTETTTNTLKYIGIWKYYSQYTGLTLDACVGGWGSSVVNLRQMQIGTPNTGVVTGWYVGIDSEIPCQFGGGTSYFGDTDPYYESGNTYYTAIYSGGLTSIPFLVFKDTYVNHLMTDVDPTWTHNSETDWSAYFSSITSSGGLELVGLCEVQLNADIGIRLKGCSGDVDTTTSTSGRGAVSLEAYHNDGVSTAPVATTGADDNLVSIRAGGTTRHLFKGDGDIYTDTGVLVAYDDEQDALACRDLAYVLSRDHQKIIKYHAPELERLGVMKNGFISSHKFKALSLGAIGEIYHILDWLLRKQGLDYETVRQEIRQQA